ncbi:MAG: M48 family metalloprotease [SAR324 cluster bacterium]|nr:M48 family metalloprotease [SAR324 cluster bacterium]
MLKKVLAAIFTIVFIPALSHARTQVLLVPKAMMNSMGTDAFKDIKKKTTQETDPQINQHVKCIAQRIVKYAKDKTGVKNWEVVVFREKTVNAFALPSGKIGVYTGLMEVAENADQLAAVMGHEVGHVTAQHGNERVSQGFLVQGGLAVLSGVLGDKSSPQNKAVMGALGLGAQYGVLLPHSRTHESEADLIGLDLMARAGFDPRESAQLWKNMGKGGGKQGPEFLSTHPSHKTRIKDLNSDMKKPLKHYQKLLRSGKQHNCGVNPFHPEIPLTWKKDMAAQAAVTPPPTLQSPVRSATCQPAPGQDFRHCDFSNRNLDGADFRNADIAGVSFKKASLKNARFEKANCRRTDFSHSKAIGARFDDVACHKANFSKADLRNAHFIKAYLQQANFRKSDIEDVNFKKADLRESNIHLSRNRSKANFEKARQ